MSAQYDTTAPSYKQLPSNKTVVDAKPVHIADAAGRVEVVQPEYEWKKEELTQMLQHLLDQHHLTLSDYHDILTVDLEIDSEEDCERPAELGGDIPVPRSNRDCEQVMEELQDMQNGLVDAFPDRQPASNVFWPCPIFHNPDPAERLTPEQMAAQLERQNLPVTVVQLEEDPEEEPTYYFAPTGGGMDLSWEIAEAYVICDALPPVELSDLPSIAERGDSEKDQHIVRSLVASNEFLIQQYQQNVSQLEGHLPEAEDEEEEGPRP